MIRRFVGRVLREPLLLFMLLGAAMFLLGRYFEARRDTSRIVITQADVRRATENYRSQYGHAPTSQEVEILRARLVDDEIFYREALKLHLDQDDEIIRRRLIQKLQFLQLDLSIPGEPSELELTRYYRNHAARYRTPATVSIAHLYFSPDLRGEPGAHRAAAQAVSHLNRKTSSSVGEAGDYFASGSEFSDVTREELNKIFGRTGLSEAVFTEAPGRWIGPEQSGLGWHAVFIRSYRPEKPLPFERARQEVLADYLQHERQQENQRRLATLRQSFQVVME